MVKLATRRQWKTNDKGKSEEKVLQAKRRARGGEEIYGWRQPMGLYPFLRKFANSGGA